MSLALETKFISFSSERFAAGISSGVGISSASTSLCLCAIGWLKFLIRFAEKIIPPDKFLSKGTCQVSSSLKTFSGLVMGLAGFKVPKLGNKSSKVSAATRPNKNPTAELSNKLGLAGLSLVGAGGFNCLINRLSL